MPAGTGTFIDSSVPLPWWKTKKSVSKNNVKQRKEPSNNTNKNAGNR